jgi:chitinase
VRTVLSLFPIPVWLTEDVHTSWEFPDDAGAGNTLSSADSTNFLLLLEEIRATKVGKELVLSAAVSLQPFNGPNDSPLNDVSMFAMVLDYIGRSRYHPERGHEFTDGYKQSWCMTSTGRMIPVASVPTLR